MYCKLFNFLCAIGLAVSLTVIVPASAAGERDLLNSERIEHVYGNYGIDVLSSTPTLRVSKLYSTHRGQQICRTFAVVFYPPQVDEVVAAEHAAILRGGSIGETFAASGWHLVKAHWYFGEIDSTAKLKTLMGGIEAHRLAVHIYLLKVAKGSSEVEYASIVEIHHPDYLSTAALHEIYGTVEIRPEDHAIDNLLALTAEQIR